MKTHIQKARELVSDIAKSLATENFEGATTALENITAELDAIHKSAEDAEEIMVQQAEAIKKMEAPQETKNDEPEKVEKGADLNIYSSSFPEMMQQLIEAVKLQGETMVGLQKSFHELATGGESKQDKTEIEKSVSALDALAEQLMPR